MLLVLAVIASTGMVLGRLLRFTRELLFGRRSSP
jgi:hypothetical protein